MTIKSHLKPAVGFESNPKSVKSNKRFYSNNIKVTFTQIISKCVLIVSNQDQMKMCASVKNVFAISFMCPIMKVFHL